MNENSVGISQQTLVSNNENDAARAKRLFQYVASLSSTLGAVAAGMVLAWTSAAGTDGELLQSEYGIDISPSEFSWIGSLSALGAGFICIPVGILADIIGRKYTMLSMIIPFTLGWLLIIFANSVVMFLIGRFIAGISSGAFCVVAPMYTAEIAENEIRGTLGSYFQLLLTIGILLSYVFGSIVNITMLSVISAIVPFIFFATFILMPESPIYYLKKGNEESARKSLLIFRGSEYDVDGELLKHRETLEETAKLKTSIWDSLKSKATIKSFIIAYGLMIFQQFSGVNVVIFYAAGIFTQTGSSIDSNLSTIIVGVIQVLSVFVSTLVVDRIGRRILLLSSAVLMFLSSFALGLYFYLAQIGTNVEAIEWLPLVSICVFIIMFSIGFGPLPWMMMGEIFAPEIKSIAASTACFLNWFLAFVVTKFFDDLKTAIDIGPTFFLFSVITFTGIFFVFILVPETKGKSLDDIQKELGRS